MNFGFKVEGVPQLLRKLEINRYGPDFRDFHQQASGQGAAAARAAAPRFSGALQAGIAAHVEPATLPALSGIVSTAPHAPPVVGGSRPHFPPPDALAGWAAAKGFGENGGFIVAKAISRRGTRPQPFLAAALGLMRAAVVGGTSRLASAIERRFGST